MIMDRNTELLPEGAPIEDITVKGRYIQFWEPYSMSGGRSGISRGNGILVGVQKFLDLDRYIKYLLIESGNGLS